MEKNHRMNSEYIEHLLWCIEEQGNLFDAAALFQDNPYTQNFWLGELAEQMWNDIDQELLKPESADLFVQLIKAKDEAKLTQLYHILIGSLQDEDYNAYLNDDQKPKWFVENWETIPGAITGAESQLLEEFETMDPDDFDTMNFDESVFDEGRTIAQYYTVTDDPTEHALLHILQLTPQGTSDAFFMNLKYLYRNYWLKMLQQANSVKKLHADNENSTVKCEGGN